MTRPITVLLVDDDNALRERVARSLEDEDMRVTEAASGDEAWHHLFTGYLPSVVLVSSVQDGIDLVHEMRAHRFFRDLPVIVYANEETRQRHAVPWVLFVDKDQPTITLADTIRRFAR